MNDFNKGVFIMTESQVNSTWIKKLFQPLDFQVELFTGFEPSILHPMSVIINDFANNIDLSFFNQYQKSDKKKEGDHFSITKPF